VTGGASSGGGTRHEHGLGGAAEGGVRPGAEVREQATWAGTALARRKAGR
jgi:hypothetical protein